MAELVDALGSGPSGSNTVQVRILFWAIKGKPFTASTLQEVYLFCFSSNLLQC